MRTVVVSAFPCCGKTYAFEHFQHKYSMLDSDSSQFSWIKDEVGNNTKERNPDFPNNYIQHIKNNIGKVDIIFVSSHKQVRDALDDAGIHFCTVYPKPTMLNEWVGRMYCRGNDPKFIQFIIDNWGTFMSEIDSGFSYGFGLCRLGNNEYIDLDFLYNWQYNMNEDLFVYPYYISSPKPSNLTTKITSTSDEPIVKGAF